MGPNLNTQIVRIDHRSPPAFISQTSMECNSPLSKSCKVELRQQLMRVLYISTIWCNAHLKYPSAISPEDCGWKLVNPDRYDFHRFDGDAMPGTISEIVMNAADDEEDKEDEEEKNEDEDTDTVSSDEEQTEFEFGLFGDSGSDVQSP
ncbi:hypothetical protein EVAR_52730_1 [Eumeta japonica]|uniref:Uncharacterized protein n=1 Tax=Eumeta variegata TaxID=151549 RepID=A0A4C1Y6T1_EUMVA|nr:hypothetical protein EVAR_52730_1 [Eumeta japonica]